MFNVSGRLSLIFICFEKWLFLFNTHSLSRYQRRLICLCFEKVLFLFNNHPRASLGFNKFVFALRNGSFCPILRYSMQTGDESLDPGDDGLIRGSLSLVLISRLQPRTAYHDIETSLIDGGMSAICGLQEFIGVSEYIPE